MTDAETHESCGIKRKPHSQPMGTKMVELSGLEFRALLDLFMCSDPWPVVTDFNQEILKAWMNKVSATWNYKDWIDAYHRGIIR